MPYRTLQERSQKQKEIRQRRRDLGLCVVCGKQKPESDIQRCARCAADNALYCANSHKKHILNGRCRCGRPVSKPKLSCASCLARSAEVIADLRTQVLVGYGHKCVCCGESTREFLAIDHTYGDGFLERRTKSGTSGSFYKKIIAEGFPTRYRLLCHNCNASLGRYGYCPHGNVKIEQRADGLGSPSQEETRARRAAFVPQNDENASAVGPSQAQRKTLKRLAMGCYLAERTASTTLGLMSPDGVEEAPVRIRNVNRMSAAGWIRRDESTHPIRFVITPAGAKFFETGHFANRIPTKKEE